MRNRVERSQIEPAVLRQDEVLQLTGLSRSSLYEAIEISEFPRPFKYPNSRLNRWLKSDVDAWVNRQAQGAANAA